MNYQQVIWILFFFFIEMGSFHHLNIHKEVASDSCVLILFLNLRNNLYYWFAVSAILNLIARIQSLTYNSKFSDSIWFASTILLINNFNFSIVRTSDEPFAGYCSSDVWLTCAATGAFTEALKKLLNAQWVAAHRSAIMAIYDANACKFHCETCTHIHRNSSIFV